MKRLFPTIIPLRPLHHLGEFLYWMLRAKGSDGVRKLQALPSAIPLLLNLNLRELLLVAWSQLLGRNTLLPTS